MIIATKGTKTDETAKDGEQGPSRHPSEAKSRLPYYLGLAVASVAAYLKSLFPEPARAEPDSDGAGEPPRTSSPKPALLLVSETGQDEELPDPRARGSSAVVEEAKIDAAALDFEAQEFIRAHSLRFAAPESRPDLGDFKRSPVIPNPINDNRGVAPAGGGGGGGHGNGCGGRKTPSPEDAGARPDLHAPDRAGGGSLDPSGPSGNGDGGGGSSPTDPTAPGETAGGRRHRAPVSTGTVHLADTTPCASLAIAALDLLRTVSDPDGDALSIRGVTASSGTLVHDGDGWLFEAGAVGLVTLTYEVTDGEFAITQTATVNVLDHARDPSPGGDGGIQGGTSGTNGDDLILGTGFPDQIDGGDGNDDIDARGGDDLIDGGPGDDHIVGGAGNDTIVGGLGHDVIFAGAGRDVVSGGPGNDRIFGGDGDDTLFGDEGNDLVDGGAGSDILVGGTGDDILDGGDGDDRIDGGDGSDLALAGSGRDVVSGGAGDDKLEGGDGDDLIADGTGRDFVRGDGGDDLIVLAMDGDDDRVDGGEGVDTLDLGDAEGDLLVDLVRHVVSGTELGNDQIESVERIVTGAGRDHFVIGGGDVVLTGGAGDDRYDFASLGGDREPTRAAQITDFAVGDHIDLMTWTFFEEAPGATGESLAEAMERKDGTVSGIRYKSAQLDDGDVTVITADFDHDDLFETTIVLDGHHTLLFVATVPAAAAPPPVTALP